MNVHKARWNWYTFLVLAGTLSVAVYLSQEKKHEPNRGHGTAEGHLPLLSGTRAAFAQDGRTRLTGEAPSTSTGAPDGSQAPDTAGQRPRVSPSDAAQGQSGGDTKDALHISGAMKVQFAAAIRDSQKPALKHLLAYPYGQDSALDGLLIDGAHRLFAVGTAAERKQARDALLSFGKHERDAGSGAVPGNQIQIAEALGSIDDPAVVSHLLDLISSDDTDRVVKGSAVVSLGELKAVDALPMIETYMQELEAELEGKAGDERAFIASSLEEASQVLEDLRRNN